MPIGMIETALSAVLFAIPVTAGSWRALGWRALICAALTLGAFLWSTGGRLSLQVEGGDANIGAGIVIYFAITTLGSGLLARTASLGAHRLGHPRPWSLWIEAVFFFGFAYVVMGALVS